MNIKTKTKSPTVIVIEQGTMDESKNDRTIKRMDSLERKLDAQYKAFVDKSDYIKAINQIQKAFMQGLNKLVAANRTIANRESDRRVDNIRNEFNVRIKELSSNRNEAILNSFVTKLGNLETAIQNMPKPTRTVRVVNRGSNLTGSFNKALQRLENLIIQSKPRMMPSPS